MTDFQHQLVALLAARDRILYSPDRQTRLSAEVEFSRLADDMRENSAAELAGIVSEIERVVSGVVGSYETTRQAVNSSLVDALMILGIISLSLAIVNLFPFLPLDGGHIFWAVAEKVRGRAIPFSVMERASVVGFFLVILLFAVGLSNDIDRLRGEGFGIR